MGIHQLPKAYPQRTIQSAVIILYHYPTCKSTVPFIYLFSFLRIIAYCVPLSVSLRTGFSQNENIISWLILLSFFPQKSLAVGGVDVRDMAKYLQAVLFSSTHFFNYCLAVPLPPSGHY